MYKLLNSLSISLTVTSWLNWLSSFISKEELTNNSGASLTGLIEISTFAADEYSPSFTLNVKISVPLKLSSGW